MATTQTQTAPAARVFTESKFFPVAYAEGAPIIKRALEHAFDMRLDEIASGMYSGVRADGDWSEMEVTVRTLRTDRGTHVEIQLEHRYTPAASTLGTLGFILGCFLILPLIPVIVASSRIQRKEKRQRLIAMHRAWTEISEAVGAPRRASYRDRPERAYAPMRFSEDAAQATEEAALVAADEGDEDDAGPERVARGG
ncbi:MAG: hypothetical protein AAF928_01430 [Myxococcota bacterium]